MSWHQVGGYQIMQHDLRSISISLVRNSGRPQESLSDLMLMIERHYREMLGPDINLVVREVSALPRTNNAGAPMPLVRSMVGHARTARIKTLYPQQTADGAAILH